MNIDGGTLAFLIGFFSLMTYALARGGEFFWLEMSRKGKARVAWVDADSGELRIEFLERRGNEVVIGKGEKAKTVILEAAARFTSRYPTWFVHPRHGWNFVPPSDAETVDGDDIIKRLAISNPALYHNMIARNKVGQALRANDEGDKYGWVMPVVITAAIVLVVILVVLGWVAVKISEQGGA